MTQHSISRRQLIATGVSAGVAATFAPGAFAQNYPSRPIRLSVGFAPGTGPDVLTRLLGQKMGELMNQPFVIDNRAGAGGQIAAGAVAKSPPDGYNLLIADVSAISIAPAAFARLAYDPAKELVVISEVARTDFILVVPANSPAKSYGDFVKAATAAKDKVNFGTFGAGTPGHFGAEMLGAQGNFKVEAVHYRATGDAVSAIVAGDVQAALMSTALASAQIKGGKVRGLATTAPVRSSMLPDIPTFREVGYPGADFSAWFCLFSPVGTPDSMIATLNNQVLAAVKAPDLRSKLEEAGFSLVGSSTVAARRMVNVEAGRWKKIVTDTGFKGVQ